MINNQVSSQCRNLFTDARHKEVRLYNLAPVPDQSPGGDTAGLNRNFALRHFPGTDLWLCKGDDTETCYSIPVLIPQISFSSDR